MRYVFRFRSGNIIYELICPFPFAYLTGAIATGKPIKIKDLLK